MAESWYLSSIAKTMQTILNGKHKKFLNKTKLEFYYNVIEKSSIKPKTAWNLVNYEPGRTKTVKNISININVTFLNEPKEIGHIWSLFCKYN